MPDIYDCLVETALSLAEQALSKDVEYSLLFIGRDREIERAIPKGEQDYRELVPRLPGFYTEPEPGLPDGAEILNMESRLGNKGSNIFLCTSRITEDLIQELIAVKQQQRNPELYYIAPPGFCDGGAGTEMASLEFLEDSGVRYHIVTAGDERE